MRCINASLLVSEEIWKINVTLATIIALCKCGEFDRDFYSLRYPESLATGLSPEEHYVLHGATEGKNPVWWFNTKLYTHANPYVVSNGINPFWHYIRYGRNECRKLWFDEEEAAVKFADEAMNSRNFADALLRWSVVREQYPAHIAGYAGACKACLELADYAQAEAFSLQGMEKAPNAIQPLICFAEVAMHQNDLETALQRWAMVRDKFPKHYAGYTRASTICLNHGHWEQAEALCSEGMKNATELILPLIAHAEIPMRQQNFVEVLKRCTIIREKFPNHLFGYTHATAACFELADWKQAENLCIEGLKNIPDSFDLLVAHAESAMRQQHHEIALKRWAVVRKHFPNEHIGYTRASTACFYMSEWLDAEMLRAEGLKKVPITIGSLIAFGNIAIQQLDFEAALALCAVVREKFPEHHHGYTRASAIYRQMGNIEQAIGFGVQGTEKFPQDAESHLEYAESLIQQQKFSAAEVVLKHSLILLPNNSRCTEKLICVQRLLADYLDDTSQMQNTKELSSLGDAVGIISAYIKNVSDINIILREKNFNNEVNLLITHYLTKKIQFRNIFRKYIFKVVSLGPACWVSSLFSRWGLKFSVGDSSMRLPFCLANHSSSDTVIKILNSNFDQYVSENYISEYFAVDRNTLCYTNTFYNIYFNHDFCKNYKNKAHFIEVLSERVKNFRNMYNESVLYVHYTNTIFTDEHIKQFLAIKTTLFSEQACLLLMDTSNINFRHISDNVYMVGNKLCQDHIFYGSTEFVCSREGFSGESTAVEGITHIIEKHFPLRNVDISDDAINQLTLAAHQKELFSDIQVIEFIEKIKPAIAGSSNNGGIVMNCNPFTNGHKYLVEHASSQVEKLIIFVVEEDKSFFCFKDRIQLVREGVAHLKNVIVVPSGKFIISTTTFPEYFFKDSPELGEFDATSDITFFGKYIAPELNIKIRFLGKEPNCRVTSQYNKQMHEILTQYGVRVEEISRIENNNTPISASLVRSYLADKKFDKIKTIVPDSTYRFIVNTYKC